MSDVLMTLTIPAKYEELLVEVLLNSPHPPMEITFFDAYAVGAHVAYITPYERVKGRARRAVTQFLMDSDAAEQLLLGLKTSMKGKKLHYWMVPVSQSGEIR